ncbi:MULTISPECIES: peroxiredoxin [unclassified Pseudonocardia]|uniref:peroxiredoxin n=1 Tax=unclassified Pseudonocardia TaxID=2619320 RepID=UPI0001FFDFA6|nr:peroxiredoxin [Pseudonocardia sp. Ae707_Ps1]OLM17209.1 Alkyl hydroperoxide reductase subunit C-like protein [Pseudonocardia sp. Ae707_Ps1]
MAVGDLATDFELADETGAPRRLTDLLAAGPVVLFFYPAAMTGGCTQEACHFRDLSAEFAELGAQPVGISSDRPDKQNMFAAANGFGFPLLSDADHTVAKSFGAWRAWLPGNFHTRRRTFVIGTDRRILAEIGSETAMTKHADDALAALRERRAA